MNKSELIKIIKEEIQTLNEHTRLNLAKLHLTKDKKTFDTLMKNIGDDVGWSKSDTLYMLKKFRKDIGYKGPELWRPLYDLPYDLNTVSRRDLMLLNTFADKKKQSWNDKKYWIWIKSVAANGGADNAYDMARNADQEAGLLDYVKKQIRKNGGDEEPYERLQWDIETQG